jgi:hypothetical protein
MHRRFPSPLAVAAAAIAASVAARASAQCVTVGAFINHGSVPTNLQPAGTLSEISGIVASRHNPGVLWVQDDSGSSAQVIALRSDATVARQYTIVGATNRDWEDIAIGPGPIAGRDYLYLADIGNNALGDATMYLYRVPEPDVPAGTSSPASLVAEVFPFHYPNGNWNAETLWIDPVDGSPYVLTKVASTTCSVFRYPLPLDGGVDKEMVLAATLVNMPTLFTGGDVSQDGRWIFARTDTEIRAWHRAPGTPFMSAFANVPCAFTDPQPQCEALGVSADGARLFAINEGAEAQLRSAPLGWPAGSPHWPAFGSALGGSLGPPGLGATAAPWLGGPPFDLAAWQLPPSGTAVVLISPWAFDDGVVSWNGGWLHAGVGLVGPCQVSVFGRGAVTIPTLPVDPVLFGLPIASQILPIDASAPMGYGMSALVLDR